MESKNYYGHIAVKTETFSRFRALREKRTDDEFMNMLLDLYQKEEKDVLPQVPQ